MKGRWFHSLLLLSLGFLGAFLWRMDYLVPVRVASPGALAAALVLVVLGFLLQAAAWQATLRSTPYRSPFLLCLASSGVSVFTRYIPGKVFSVLGRAVFVAERRGFPRSALSMLSLSAQLIAIWTGLGLGAAGLLAAGAPVAWGGSVAIGWLFLSVLIFTDFAHGAAERLAGLLLRRDTELPRLRFGSIIAVVVGFGAMWTAWALGFHLLALALFGPGAPPGAGFVFPLATTIGIVAVFAPGGLGIREGAMVAFLTALGFEASDAVTLSVYARVWFLAGEGTVFVLGLVAARLGYSTSGTPAD